MVSPTLKMQRQGEVLAVDLHRNKSLLSVSRAGTFHRPHSTERCSHHCEWVAGKWRSATSWEC